MKQISFGKKMARLSPSFMRTKIFITFFKKVWY